LSDEAEPTASLDCDGCFMGPFDNSEELEIHTRTCVAFRDLVIEEKLERQIQDDLRERW
jgi:hypothetical protein